MSIAYTVIVFCALGQIGAKATLHVYLEEIVIDTIDPTYFDVEKTEGYIVESSTEENTISSNMTMVKSLPKEAEGHLELLEYSMGKYNVDTGVNYWMGLCEMLDEPIILGKFFAVLGFKKEACPPEPGNYFQEGYKVPMDTLPDNFRENKYMAIFEIALNRKSLVVVKIYLEIQN